MDKSSILQPALRTLLSLVYSGNPRQKSHSFYYKQTLFVSFLKDFGSQLYKPGADPETMLVAMEWVGTLFQR